jgi:hypothetical protein
MSMGRGSDTRMYGPRSESDKMYSSANEDETKYNPADPEYNEKKREEKKRKVEEKKAMRAKIKHIKISAKDGLSGEESPNPLDDGNKRDDERELGLQGGPAGSRGTLLDLATGAKSGTGSAMSPGLPIAMSEPMEDAWSSLLKMSEAEALHYYRPERHAQRYIDKKRNATGNATGHLREGMTNKIRSAVLEQANNNVRAGIPKYLRFAHSSLPEMMRQRALVPDEKQPWLSYRQEEKNEIADSADVARNIGINPETLYNRRVYSNTMLPTGSFTEPEPEPEQIIEESPIPGMVFINGQLLPDPRGQKSEPMEDAWSSLLKTETARSIAGRRKREARQQFRPSTGQFKTPPGGMSGGVGATMRRFKAQMRGIKSGKKTGLMKPHLAVEMSHRGIQTKQPLSKDPQKYTQYKGQSEARKILGGARTTFSPHARYGARSNQAGPTGAGRLSGLMAGQSGQMARPALRRMPRPRMPRMPRMNAPTPPTPPMMPQMQSSVPSMPAPSSTMMMSEDRYRSEILKARNSLHRIELLNLMRRLIQAKEREAKIKKNLTATDSAQVPGHPAGVKPSDDEDPDGPIQNLETDAKTFGLDPAGAIIGRGGRR